MKSRFDRTSYLARLGTSAGIGALAIITGACSESAGTDADVVPANTGNEVTTESVSASTDGENSTDMAAPEAGNGTSVDGDAASGDEASAAEGEETEGAY